MSDSERSPRCYLLNTAILTAYGDWRFEGPMDVERAKEELRGGFASAIGHAGAAEFLSRLLGVDVPVNRVSAEMQPGDKAVVLRLKARLPEGAVYRMNRCALCPLSLDC